MVRAFLTSLVIVIGALCARPAAAQERYQSTSAAVYGLASFELAAIVSAPILVAIGVGAPPVFDMLGGGDPTEAFWRSFFEDAFQVLVAALAAAAISGASSIAASQLDPPAEPPLVIHVGLRSAAALAGVGAAAVGLADRRASVYGALIGGLVGATGAVWAAYRSERLSRDPALLGPAHFLTWAPATASLIAGLVLAASTSDTRAAVGIAGALSAIATVVGIVWTELTPESREGSGRAMLASPVSWSFDL